MQFRVPPNPSSRFIRTLLVFCCVLGGAVGTTRGAPFDQIAKIVPDWPALDARSFGDAISIEGGTAGIGYSPYKQVVALYDVDSGQYLQDLKTEPTGDHDGFGHSVVINNGVALVSAPFDNINGLYFSGSAFLFDMNTGQQLHQLLPDINKDYGNFGISIALSNDVAVVGEWFSFDFDEGSGAVYLFDVHTGELTRKLMPQDGEPYQGFGASVAISGDIVVVGTGAGEAYGLDQDRVGSVYLFDVNSGEQIGKLIPEEVVTGLGYGVFLKVHGDKAVVSAYSTDSDGASPRAAAYLFDLTTGSQIAKLTPSDAAPDDLFGFGIALNDDMVAVGAQYHDYNGVTGGAVYLFDVDTGDQIAKLVADDADDSFGFGNTVSLGDGVLAVSALYRIAPGNNAGVVYLFEIPEPASLIIAGLGAVAVSYGRRR